MIGSGERRRSSSRTRWLGGLWLTTLASCHAEQWSGRGGDGRDTGLRDGEPVVTVRNESAHAITDAIVSACGAVGAAQNQLRNGGIPPGGGARIVLGHAGCHDIVARAQDGSIQRFTSVEVRGETVVEVRAP